MKMYIMMAMLGGLGVAGFMYLKKHPGMMKIMKNDISTNIDKMMG